MAFYVNIMFNIKMLVCFFPAWIKVSKHWYYWYLGPNTSCLGGSCSPYDIYQLTGFPGGSNGKEFSCSAGVMGLILGLGRVPGEGNSCPPQYSGLENSMDCIVLGFAKSWIRLINFHFGLSVTRLSRVFRSWFLIAKNASMYCQMFLWGKISLSWEPLTEIYSLCL